MAMNGASRDAPFCFCDGCSADSGPACNSTPGRIVRAGVPAIGNAVAVAVPAAALKPPAPILLDPSMRTINMARALAHPRAVHPHIVPVLPVPVAGRPDITLTRAGNAFVPRRRRRRVHVDIDSHRRDWHCSCADYPGGQQRRHEFSSCNHLNLLNTPSQINAGPLRLMAGGRTLAGPGELT